MILLWYLPSFSPKVIGVLGATPFHLALVDFDCDLMCFVDFFDVISVNFICFGINKTQCEGHNLVVKSNVIRVDRYIKLGHGGCKPTRITSGHHIVGSVIDLGLVILLLCFFLISGRVIPIDAKISVFFNEH